MKGSSLHRSGLTREKIGLLASLLYNDKKPNTRNIPNNNHYKSTKNHELDILWGGVQKGIQKVHNATKGSHQKSPAAYLIIGFIAGVLFMSCITFIVSISTMAPKTVANIEAAAENSEKAKNNEENTVVVPDENGEIQKNSTAVEPMTAIGQEKYVVKQGDTLNGIAYRFYGKYDEAKINEILKVNNISNPEALKIDQELIIPLYQ